jgi:hypothetical protein
MESLANISELRTLNYIYLLHAMYLSVDGTVHIHVKLHKTQKLAGL